MGFTWDAPTWALPPPPNQMARFWCQLVYLPTYVPTNQSHMPQCPVDHTD